MARPWGRGVLPQWSPNRRHRRGWHASCSLGRQTAVYLARELPRRQRHVRPDYREPLPEGQVMDHDFIDGLSSSGGSALMMFLAGGPGRGRGAILVRLPGPTRVRSSGAAREFADDVTARGTAVERARRPRDEAVMRGYEQATGAAARNDSVNGATQSGHSMWPAFGRGRRPARSGGRTQGADAASGPVRCRWTG